MGAAVTASASLVPGAPPPGLREHLIQVQVAAYSSVGERERSIHNDLDIARQNGLCGTIAQGLQLAGYVSEVCRNVVWRGVVHQWVSEG